MFAVKFLASAAFSYLFLCAVLAIYVAVAANSLTFEPTEASDCVGGDGHYDCSYTNPNPTYGYAALSAGLNFSCFLPIPSSCLCFKTLSDPAMLKQVLVATSPPLPSTARACW